MKILFLSIFVIYFTLAVRGQESGTYTSTAKNVFKVNVPALALKNISVQYERAVAPKLSLATGFRYMAVSSLPLKRFFNDVIDDPVTERQLNNFKVGNYALTPELRFYLGKAALKGFYLGPFISIARYKSELLFEYGDQNIPETIPMKGDVNSLTGGVMIGAQWHISKAIFFDWWIAGPHYGLSNGEISGSRKLDARQQQLVREELDKLDIPFTKFTYVVDANGATVNFKGPWAGVRSGFCIGLSF